ncbi:uncharacterized protein F4822DRAFT_403572 [Hypoxylon trugodes]|uniref:uncharacterized protein n=1 Tax=Hypoxylon trugodes TaxID=326681 RepID=UPI0021905569|nr:uncharacterized protein F4822DRAFT_403572 [Hypoxylon trugodes]KAI1388693.1 hypothetical protein F4822DRAFT_403572 [Hypoxylon trugodes]
MVPRRVIADSDDEDDGDNLNALSPAREETGVPEVEPLSPQHRPSSDANNRTSGTTDQSFFAGVHDEQQNRAVDQSRLIEQIVRQSQKASGSSGDVSLPAQGKRKRVGASSGTNVTSPDGMSKLGNRMSLLSDDATSITTPRKSAPGEWDVPSSAEGVSAPRSAKSSKGKKEKSYGKKRRNSKTLGSSATAEIFMREGLAVEGATQESPARDGMSAAIDEVEQSPLPATKRRRLSILGPAIQETEAVTNFYVPQGNLTTMQRLEYQQTSAPQNGYSNLYGSIANQKSSGMTTIAYSTPSRYASSSGGPLPWERESALEFQANGSPGVISINSSPAAIAAEDEYIEGGTTETTYIDTQEVIYEDQDLTKGHTTMSPSGKKRKQSQKSMQDEEDELARINSSDPKPSNRRRDSHKRRRRNDQIPNSPNPLEGGENIELIPNPVEELPTEEVHQAEEQALEIPSTEPPPAPISVPEPPQEAQPTPQPKKRGRKKKQPAAEPVTEVEQPIENQIPTQERVSTTKDSDAQVEPGKSKKKRGRPRKSDQAKSETAAAPEPQPEPEPEPHSTSKTRVEAAPEQVEATEKPKPKKQARKQEEISEIADEDETEDASPLEEISNNSRTPSRGSISTKGVSTTPNAESSTDQKLPPKTQEKGSSTPKPTPTSSQPKVPYRVGLSKRTRITSLLKSIKR